MSSYSELKTKKDKKAFLQNLLDSSTLAVEVGILKIYNLQTEAERNNFKSSEHNGVGFSKIDCALLSSFACQIESGAHLTPKQLNIARPKIKKYWRQLMIISDKKVKSSEPKYIQQTLNI